ncbi:preprotein translocase subunit SecB [Thiohalorhabdus denitrificans]|uniref:Protein-export protein SecB n=1 Tax=Thiohalorhabdus denitrificans TaxID=381306 RepID=A0A0N8PMS1_9GAMM|nr:protein-export chaperone SecB [Thiohalorhabdus denitrificans]KPV39509.1 preprotein translocase subunit SecB [Thiohalorhabdus denitrificans]SCY00280.1 protein translocase subunit secB [Thiohalorhabdus denitrificans]
MSEEQGASGEQPVFALERVYVKDVSFESPNVPDVFTWQGQPQVNVELGTQGRVVSDQGHVESVLTVTVRSTHEDRTVFIAEVQQAGLFRVSGVPDEQLEQLMGINCPTILFPYAREAISNMVTHGGFQQLLLDPVNFQALYEQSRQQQAGEAGEH